MALQKKEEIKSAINLALAAEDEEMKDEDSARFRISDLKEKFFK